MTARAVSFDGTRVNAADANTNWGNLGGGGPSPAAEPQLVYQGTNAVNRKVTSTSARQGVQYDPASGALDMTAAANRLAFLKGYVSDFGDLNTTYGCEMRIGSANSAYYHYNVAGSGANRAPYDNGYPAQGGYILAAINPNNANWREGTQGSPSLTAVDYFGFAAQFVSGAAKSENLAMDAIDVGRGLIITLGTGADPDGNFVDFLEVDQDTTGNRWGVVNGTDPVVFARGQLQIGNSGGTETDFSDDFSTVIFVDGYYEPGDVGVRVEMQNASSVISVDNTLIGLGSSTTSDTRPDFVVVGTTGTFSCSALITNFRNVTFTSICSVDGADIECQLLTQASADIENCTIRTNAVSGVACLQDPTFGTTTDLHDTEFEQTGAGHAIEIDSVGTYDFNNLFFTGYGADATNSAAVYVSVGSGTVTINVNGGDTPTVRTAGATVVINNAVSVTVRGVTRGTPVKVIADETVGTVTEGDVLGEGFADQNGVFSFSQNYEGAFDPSGLDVIVRARNQGVATAVVADDGGSFTDETTEGSSNATGDMTLLPTTPAVNDAYYFGHQDPFTRLKLDISTARVGTLTIVWEYWNGSSWASLTGLTDGTNGFQNSGANIVSWTLPGNWATTTVTNQANTGPLYYVRARVSAFTSITTTPVGRKVTLDVSRYLPYDAERVIESTGLTDTATWTRDLISKFSPSD